MELLQLFAAYGGALSPLVTLLGFWQVSLQLNSLQERDKSRNEELDDIKDRLNRLEGVYFGHGRRS